MIVVTGAAGFIGSNLVKALNRRGCDDIVVVDESAAEKSANLADLAIRDFIDKQEFLAALQRGPWRGKNSVSAVLHQGACSDTMATDDVYVMENNFAYSKALYHFCAEHRAQYIYASSASVYGGGDVFVEAPQNESALNVYARSKLQFDEFVRTQDDGSDSKFQCVGLRYFNVYGVREQHKEKMASVPWHFFNQYQRDGKVRLFEGSGGYADGEQRRDFVSVEDIVAVNLFFLDHPSISGIYNTGTGQSRSFNEVAVAVLNACRVHRGAEQTSLEQALAAGEISYIPMPDALHGKYQSYTQANLDRLRASGYTEKFLDVPQGVGRYIAELSARS